MSHEKGNNFFLLAKIGFCWQRTVSNDDDTLQWVFLHDMKLDYWGVKDFHGEILGVFFCEAAIVTHSYCISDSMDLNHDFSQSSRKSVFHLFIGSVSLLFVWLGSWLGGWLIDLLAGWLVSWMVTWLIGWLVDWLGWLFSWLLVDYYLVDELVGWLTVAWLVGCLIS